MTVAHLWLNGNMVELDTGKHSYASNFETGGPGWEELGKGELLPICPTEASSSATRASWVTLRLSASNVPRR